MLSVEQGNYIDGYGGKKIFLYEWDKVERPRGIVQIFHGMAEHAGRYKEFADYLNENGFVVYADDHRGHGRTAIQPEELGDIGEDGFNNIVEDEKIINEHIRDKHKDIPLIILGHSFGSFIGQEFLIRYSHMMDGIILSGSAARTGIDVHVGKLFAGIQKKFFGGSKEAKLLDKISFMGYNSKFKGDGSSFSWLSRDREQVNKYENDKFCGMVCKVGFFYSFFQGMSNLYNEDRLAKIDKNQKIFIVSGNHDPVGMYGKGVEKLFDNYKRIGVESVDIKLYEKARHEILNEINKKDVYKDIMEKLEDWCAHMNIEKGAVSKLGRNNF